MLGQGAFKPLLLIVLAASFLTAGTIGYFQNPTLKGLGHYEIGIDAEGFSDFNGMISALDQQLSQLEPVPSTQQSTIQTIVRSQWLFGQPSSSLTQMQTRLQAYRQSLEDLLGPQDKANVTGFFFYGTGLSYVIFTGAYANLGRSVAYSTQVGFTFYSQPNGQGTVLCSMTYRLGDIAGQFLNTLGRITCGTGRVTAGSMVFQFEWSQQ